MLSLWLGLSSTVVADVYYMDFPVKLNGEEVAQLSAGLDGFELYGVQADEFVAKLEKNLSASVIQWLRAQQKTAITVAQFKQQGVNLTFLPQDMMLELTLEEQAMATDQLNYTRGANVVTPQNDAQWAFLSSFNLHHRRANNNSSYDSRIEWLMDANIGGGDGLNFEGSLFWDSSRNRQSQIYRGDLTWFYDEPDKPRRISFGDTQNRVTGHLSSYQVGGIAISSAYAQLQPRRNLTPGNSQVFTLPRHASIEVYVNGFMISRLRLKPGRYDIKDLPLTTGSNKVRVVAIYADGKTEEFDFTTHYNAQLLSEGLSSYSFVFGRPSTINNNVYHYEGSLLATGTYEYGMSDTLTLGGNMAAQSKGFILGSTATLGYDWGNLSLRYSQSHGREHKGHAFSIETEHSVFGQSDFGSPNLRLGFHNKRDFSTFAWQNDGVLVFEKRFNFDYSYFINDHFDFGLFGNVSFDQQNQRNKELTAQLNWRDYGMNVSLGYSYDDQPTLSQQDQSRFFLNFTWSWFDTVNSDRQRLRYSSRSKSLTANYAHVNRNYMDDYGYEITAEKGSDYRREQLRASYTGRTFRADLDADNSARDNQLDRGNIGINLSTSVGVADGHIGIGPNVSAPFAVIDKHKSLGDTDVLINVNRNNKPQTQTGSWSGALINLGTGYNATQFNVDVPDAPFGYDWGPGTYKLSGGASTGHFFQIGSALSYTIMGVMLDTEGQPISLKRGVVVQPGHDFRKTIFTNRAGRFVIEGIGEGEFEVQIGELKGLFSIAEGEERFIDIGEIKLASE